MLTVLRLFEKDEPYSYSTENGLEGMVAGKQVRDRLSTDLFMRIIQQVNRAVCHPSEYMIQNQLEFNYMEKVNAR